MSGDPSQQAGQTVYIFDEPETHLHPLAQEQAAAWIAERVRSGALVLLATHAVPFLGLPLEDVEYFKVTRSPAWETNVERISPDVLGAVKESAEELGLPPTALIQLTRAWLVVEGEHDRRILESFYGKELGRARIQILPLRGARSAKAAFLQLGALAHLGQPFFCLLDNTRAEAVKTGRLSTDRMTEEERIAEQLWRLSQQDGVDVSIVGLPHPDIICELPIEAVRQVAADNGGRPQAACAWSDLIERHRQRSTEMSERGQRAPSFKTFALDSIGLGNWSPGRLVEETLRVCEAPPQASALSRIVSEIVAATGDGRLGAD